ncbi:MULTISPECIES: carboxymuconolactone decarboxylase family protein [unclassified Kutzneria]|uniref:carboxymuconolactone decarboxylase family protein n=1 Tax=unclassified Kutzneria TaxID=2621979 RepID=UPI0003EEC173|nr:carboxymuconolactone decarboxylase family protein [Kutzneria sp. 744]EWM18401.1 4-carboxymuconolactone decarboxylase [Kutzneria sp. 744]
MAARMTNPAKVLPDTVAGVQGLFKAIYQGGVPKATLDLVHLRASQINGCGYCVDAGVTSAQKAGESVDRLLRVSAWRESDLFTDAERAALALTEAATRMADQVDPVSDAVWDDAADHFDEKALSAIILMIATTNFFNRINVTVRQPAGEQF